MTQPNEQLEEFKRIKKLTKKANLPWYAQPGDPRRGDKRPFVVVCGPYENTQGGYIFADVATEREADLIASVPFLVGEVERLLEANKRLKNEITSHAPEGRNYTNEQYVALRLKLEQTREELEEVKTELSRWREGGPLAKQLWGKNESLHTELAAKDKVLEETRNNLSWTLSALTRYVTGEPVPNLDEIISGVTAFLYPPREKGATE